MRKVSVAVAALTALGVAGCGGGAQPGSSTSAPARVSIEVTSSAFRAGAPSPRLYTCDGKDVSPPLRADGLPAATKEVVVIMRDPDAPGGNFIHWAIAGIEPTNRALDLPAAGKPPGAVLGRNSFGSLGYRGPCPPAGPAHHYRITVYALADSSGLKQGFSAGEAGTLPILGQGTLTGTYARH